MSSRNSLLVCTLCFLVTLLVIYYPVVAVDENTVDEKSKECANPEKPESCANPEKIPLLQIEELQKYNGKVKGEKIYLSILGDVYDVTKGAEYYAEGAGYHGFAGRDAAVPFVTGVFTEEESQKSTDVLKDGELYGMKTWVDFYRNEERYPFLGHRSDLLL